MKPQVPFAITLVLAAGEEADARALKLIRSFRSPPKSWVVEGLDATGVRGNALSAELNQMEFKVVANEELCQLLGEEGQVIELDALALGEDDQLLAQVTIADCSIVSWMGFGDPTEEGQPGEFQRWDCGHFLWPDSVFQALRARAEK